VDKQKFKKNKKKHNMLYWTKYYKTSCLRKYKLLTFTNQLFWLTASLQFRNSTEYRQAESWISNKTWVIFRQCCKSSSGPSTQWRTLLLVPLQLLSIFV